MAASEDDGFELIDRSEVTDGPVEYEQVADAGQAPEGDAPGGEPVGHEVESLLALTLAYLSGCCQAASVYVSLASKRVSAAYQRALDSQAFASAAAAAAPAAAHARALARTALAAGKQHAVALGGACEQAFAKAAVRAQEAQLPPLLQPPNSSTAERGPEAAGGSMPAARLLRALAALLARELLLLAFLAQELYLACLRCLRCLPRRPATHAQAA